MKLSDNQRRLLWWAWLIAVGLVIAGSLLPGSSFPIRMLRGLNDALLHFVAYVVLGLLPIIWAESRRAAILAVLSMVVLGLALEYGQTWVPGRGFELMDLLADDLGLLCGVLLGIRFVR